ncbi:MAG: LuxR C-terminal-related transcriptional regulator, partial [Anaerolineales bacterium]
DLVRRERLTELLQSGLQTGNRFNRKLTLISAPAGYGKTTLASQWISVIDVPVAWLTLEPSENDPTRFNAYLVAALQTAAPGSGTSVQGMLQDPNRPSQELILTTLINQLSAFEGAFLLVLDDYQVIQSPVIHEALNYLVDHLPPNMHLVITSREDPPLPLARLEARREMLSVRQAKLRFDVDEATAYFNSISSLALTSQQAGKLTRRTEGWVTGLQLAALSMSSTKDRDAFIETFTGSNRYILDYLFEEVFEGQTDEMRSFLLHTAVLNRICADLANSITGQSNGQDLLEQLEHSNFFIVPHDQTREWYRYHRLFADLLRHRLNNSEYSVGKLHERASYWYAEHDYLEEAIEHALVGQHWELAGETIEAASDARLRRGEIGTLLGWCRRMPEEVLLSRPELALAYAWPLILLGKFDEADRVLQHIKEMVPNMPDDLLGQVMAAEAFSSRSQGDMERTIKLSKRALTLIPEDDLASRGNIALNLGLITWHLGQLDEAEIALREALEATSAPGNDYAHHTALVFMARTHAARGNLIAALEPIERAIQMGDRIPSAVLAYCDKAAIHFERNELKSAWDHLERASAIADSIQNTEFSSACCVLRASFHLSLKQIDAAKSALAPALAYCQTKDVPRLSCARIKSFQVELALANGDFETADQIHGSLQLPHDAATFTRFIDLNTARIHLAKGEKGEARQALLAAQDRAAQSGWGYALHIIRVLQARTAEDLDRAIDFLQPVFEEGESQGFLRVFLNEGDEVKVILWEAARRGVAVSYVERILDAAGSTVSTMPRNEGLIELLSERELEVLRLVAAGMSNRQVAEQLIVSLGTAKSHIHHIFGKLGVSNRTEAASKARKLGLI